jgi:hypothetical protein
MLELGVATGIFLLLVGLVSITLTQSVATTVQLRLSEEATQQVDNLVTEISELPYSQLIGNTFSPPDIGYRGANGQCSGYAQVGTNATSCVNVAGVSVVVDYVLTLNPVGPGVQNASLTLQATTWPLPNNTIISEVTQIYEPLNGYEAGYATLVVKVDAPSAFNGSIFLMSGAAPAGPAVSSAPSKGGVAVLQTDLTGTSPPCTSDAPCQLALDSSGDPADGGWALTEASVSGPGTGIVLVAGAQSLTEATVISQVPVLTTTVGR